MYTGIISRGVEYPVTTNSQGKTNASEVWKDIKEIEKRQDELACLKIGSI